MNNILVLLIDSMNNMHVKNSPITLTPFLNRLKEKGLYCDDMYSQAPYTEAAVMGIYCGQDVLQHGGYLFRYRDTPLTIFEAMKNKGYRTYYNTFQPQCHPSSVRRGIDDIYYDVGYDLNALWSYRLAHYAQLHKKNQLTESDYEILKDIFEDNFSEWLCFVDNIINKSQSVSFILDKQKGYDAIQVKKEVSKEYETYLANPQIYITEVLEQAKSHKLFSIQAFFQNEKIQNRTIMPQVRKILKPVCKRIRKMNFRLNIKNCKGIFKGPFKQLGIWMKKPCKENMKNVAKSGLLSINQLFDLDLFERIGKDYDGFKNATSLRTHIDHYINWRKDNKDLSFGFIHVDDIHNPEVFFTYDTEDLDLIKKEKEDAENILNQIPKDYHGSLTHDLSLRYIDGVIEYLYNKMDENGFLENTTIIISADHGFSFSGNPLRDSAVINLFLENYNIPCIITGPNVPHKKVEGLHASKDIPVTICDLADGIIPDVFTGKSLLEKKSYDILQIEYCGGGCPDLLRRELKMAAFDNEYFVGTLATLQTPIDEKNVTEIYDLKLDPEQKCNLLGKVSMFCIQKYINHINQRKNEIFESLSTKQENVYSSEKALLE